MQNRKTASYISKTKLKKFKIKRSLFVKMNLIDLPQNQNGKSMSNLKIPAKELLILLKNLGIKSIKAMTHGSNWTSKNTRNLKMPIVKNQVSC